MVVEKDEQKMKTNQLKLKKISPQQTKSNQGKTKRSINHLSNSNSHSSSGSNSNSTI
jgi:ADP-ribosylglycohydrolase